MNTSLFLQKLDTLKNRPSVSLPALEAIQRWVLEFSDTLPTQQINPIQIATYANLPVNHVVPELLHAIPIGLFDLNWEVHCLHCHVITAGYQHFSQAAHHAYCQGCQKEFEADSARWVDVTFSLNKELDDREFTPIGKFS